MPPGKPLPGIMVFEIKSLESRHCKSQTTLKYRVRGEELRGIVEAAGNFEISHVSLRSTLPTMRLNKVSNE